jgi:hypothetical protein
VTIPLNLRFESGTIIPDGTVGTQIPIQAHEQQDAEADPLYRVFQAFRRTFNPSGSAGTGKFSDEYMAFLSSINCVESVPIGGFMDIDICVLVIEYKKEQTNSKYHRVQLAMAMTTALRHFKTLGLHDRFPVFGLLVEGAQASVHVGYMITNAESMPTDPEVGILSFHASPFSAHQNIHSLV